MFTKLCQETELTALPTQLPKGPEEIAMRGGLGNLSRGNPFDTPVTGMSATKNMLSDAVASALTSAPAILRN